MLEGLSKSLREVKKEKKPKELVGGPDFLLESFFLSKKSSGISFFFSPGRKSIELILSWISWIESDP